MLTRVWDKIVVRLQVAGLREWLVLGAGVVIACVAGVLLISAGGDAESRADETAGPTGAVSAEAAEMASEGYRPPKGVRSPEDNPEDRRTEKPAGSRRSPADGSEADKAGRAAEEPSTTALTPEEVGSQPPVSTDPDDGPAPDGPDPEEVETSALGKTDKAEDAGAESSDADAPEVNGGASSDVDVPER